jgi:hypothetical protein
MRAKFCEYLMNFAQYSGLRGAIICANFAELAKLPAA